MLVWSCVLVVVVVVVVVGVVVVVVVVVWFFWFLSVGKAKFSLGLYSVALKSIINNNDACVVRIMMIMIAI